MSAVALNQTAAEEEAADLASLVASRLCHDLVSPIGAIGNGVELLGMSGVGGPEVDLIGESVEGANARIRLYRIAFGSAAIDQTIESSQIASIIGSPHRGSKVRMSLNASGPIDRSEAKLAVLLLMCLETAMVQGGEAAALRQGTSWRIEARAPTFRADPMLWAHLTGGEGAEPTASAVQFPLAARAAERIGRRISVDMGPDRIVILA